MSEENKSVQRRQRLLFAGVCAAAVLVAGVYIFSSGGQPTNAERAEDLKSRRAMADLINPPGMADDFLSETGTRLSSLESTVQRLEASTSRFATQLTEKDRELAAARAELGQARDQATAMVEDLAARVADRETIRAPIPAGRPADSTSPAIADPFARAGAVPGSGRIGVVPDPAPSLPPPEPRRMEIVQFEPASASLDMGVLQPAVFTLDDGDYVPPNAYARATVLVGVDMTTGVRLGSDPKPVLLRITGPAFSVIEGGRQLDTDLTGCLVNGAAHAELSSERVYVQLQKITCERGNGEVAESPVEGYVAQLGKVGIRGRVVSREGDIVSKALVAGTLSGIGRGVSRTSDFGVGGLGTGSTTVIGTDRPDAGEIATGAIGEGISTAADTVADYLIDRAEQYQPVIEMPTGIEVELVFLSGFFARGDQ